MKHVVSNQYEVEIEPKYFSFVVKTNDREFHIMLDDDEQLYLGENIDGFVCSLRSLTEDEYEMFWKAMNNELSEEELSEFVVMLLDGQE